MSDTATKALQTALSPQTGMRRIPLSLESYQHTSAALSSKKLVNMYAEQEPADARVAAALRPTPGLSVWLPVGSGPIHAINDDQPGSIYVVSGTHFYLINKVTGSFVATDLGDIGTPSGGFDPDHLLYSIAASPTEAVVCCPPNAYVSANGLPVTQITTTWPSYGASSVTYLDGYFVFTGQMQPQTFFITKLADPTAGRCARLRVARSVPECYLHGQDAGHRPVVRAGLRAGKSGMTRGTRTFPSAAVRTASYSGR